uniref:Uncharacterized protein n=1 Tax=Arundo donax TaxID=35708 RepID=A0A0A9DML1_ARUDO
MRGSCGTCLGLGFAGCGGGGGGGGRHWRGCV